MLKWRVFDASLRRFLVLTLLHRVSFSAVNAPSTEDCTEIGFTSGNYFTIIMPMFENTSERDMCKFSEMVEFWS